MLVKCSQSFFALANVRNLGIFMVNLIQKYNISRFVTAYMCMCISLMNATTCRHDIQIDTVRTQSAVITEIRMYPAEGPMPRALVALFTLVDIVRCSKSWTTVDVERCSQCSPTNGSPGRDALLGSNHREEDGFRGRSPPGRRRTWTSSRGSLPKNLIAAHPVQVS